jgi:hypothetical protein
MSLVVIHQCHEVTNTTITMDTPGWLGWSWDLVGRGYGGKPGVVRRVGFRFVRRLIGSVYDTVGWSATRLRFDFDHSRDLG